jgi:hypothetical protein
MGNKSEHDKDTFEDLGAFEAVRIGVGSKTGNIIKNTQVVAGGTRAIELHEGEDDQPSVVIHRDHDRVSRIEFLCSCGRGTSVSIEYDGE